MKNFIDKAVVMLFSSLLILNIFSGSYRVIMLFLLVIAASFTSFLRMLGGKGLLVNRILSVLIGICTVFFTDAIVFLPIAAYEIYLDRLYPAGLVLVAGFLRFCTGDGFEGNLLKLSLVSLCVYIAAETLLAVYMAYSTQRLIKYETENRKIRDEGEIKKETLSDQLVLLKRTIGDFARLRPNTILMQATKPSENLSTILCYKIRIKRLSVS